MTTLSRATAAVLAFCMPSVASADTNVRIAKSDLKSLFVEISIAERTEGKIDSVLSDSFEYWEIIPYEKRSEALGWNMQGPQGYLAKRLAARYKELEDEIVRPEEEIKALSRKRMVGLYYLRDMEKQVHEVRPNQILVVMSNWYAFESVPNVLTLWDAVGDSLVLDNLFDTYVTEGIGGVGIDDVIDLSNTESLIVGNSEGGDGGEGWGSLWYGYWYHPSTFRMIYRKRWKQRDSELVELSHELDRTALTDVVIIRKRDVAITNDHAGQSESSSNWVVTARDSVRLQELISAARQQIRKN